MFVFSAPGESPPPVQRDAGTTSRRMSEAIPYEIQTMVSDIRQVLKSQAGANGQHLSVSITRAPSVTKYLFTVS